MVTREEIARAICCAEHGSCILQDCGLLDGETTACIALKGYHDKTIDAVLALLPAQEWQDISTAPTGDDDFYLVCCNDPADDRSPFVVRGSIFASARKHPPAHHLSMAYLTHWMPLPAKPVAIIAEERAK